MVFEEGPGCLDDVLEGVQARSAKGGCGSKPTSGSILGQRHPLKDFSICFFWVFSQFLVVCLGVPLPWLFFFLVRHHGVAGGGEKCK